MDQSSPTSSPPGLQLADIYYTLFRHKWKIILCSLAGFGASYAYSKLNPPPFFSQAKLFIRYVMNEDKSLSPNGNNAMKSPDQRGETIINSEVEILTSMDLAEDVVKSLTPQKILANQGGGNDAAKAAAIVRGGLSVIAPQWSSVIRLQFENPDLEVVQLILREIIDSYKKKHVEIHRAVGIVGDFLTQETDQLRARLANTEEELRKLTNKAGIVSLEASKQGFAQQLGRNREEIYAAQAKLAELNSVYEQMTKGQPAPAAGDQSAPAASPAQVDAYQKLLTRQSQIQQRLADVMTQFTDEAAPVKQLKSLLADSETQKKQLETQFPALAQTKPVTPNTPNQAAQYDPVVANAQINALQARVKMLLQQMEQIRTEASNLDQMEISILELRRRKELDETNYRYYAATLEQSRINEALGGGRVSNISVVEAPTPPFRTWAKFQKTLAGIALGGVGVGLGWAFLIDFFLDRTIRRPTDVERTLRLPLFLSIPKIGLTPRRSRLRLPKLFKRKPKALPLPEQKNTSPFPDATAALPATLPGALPGAHQPLMPGGSEVALNPFYETLRDRLINYFDSINVRHKPKLVALTGLGRDSGVTTIAAGLARSFSEIGEGNVLLVDMTQGQGSAHHFHKGSPVGLEQLLDTRGSAFVQGNLYVVSEASSNERLAKGMPQRFNQLIPKLKASDFDYIIFDMPPVNQISITPRLASFMDMMLLVIESEKADRDIALAASGMLAKSKSPVAVVLNKTKSYIPAVLHQDRDFLLGT